MADISSTTNSEDNWTKNSKDNVAYGDNIERKQDGTLRIYYQNIHGIKKSNTWHDYQYSLTILKKWKVDIMAYSETNINWRDDDRQNIKTLIKPCYRNCTVSTSNSIEQSSSYFQQGGTSTIITNSYTGRVIENLTDKSGLGRWSGYKLRCGNSRHLSILTAYCPILDSKYETNTCYQQQWRILNQQSEYTIEPRQRMINDLQSTILELLAKQDEVILMWDANTSMDNNAMNRMFTTLNLFKLMPETPD